MGDSITFENHRVRVHRVTHTAREQHSPVSRNDRLIIYLRDGHITRIESGKREVIQHKAGDVVWRGASHHQIVNMSNSDHEVVIIELKET